MGFECKWGCNSKYCNPSLMILANHKLLKLIYKFSAFKNLVPGVIATRSLVCYTTVQIWLSLHYWVFCYAVFLLKLSQQNSENHLFHASIYMVFNVFITFSHSGNEHVTSFIKRTKGSHELPKAYTVHISCKFLIDDGFKCFIN